MRDSNPLRYEITVAILWDEKDRKLKSLSISHKIKIMEHIADQNATVIVDLNDNTQN